MADRAIRRMKPEARREVRATIAARLAAGELSLREAVRLMRLGAGMTQQEYARLTGVNLKVLAGIERGEGNPRLDTLEKLARPYGLMVSFVRPAREIPGEELTVSPGSEDPGQALR